MRTGEGVWPRVMKKEEGSLVRALCNCQEQEREKQRSITEEREKMGRKKERVGPVTVLNWDPHEFSPNLNPDWVQKQANG